MAKKKVPEASKVHKRQGTFLKNREIRHLVQGQSCRMSIGKLYKGCEIFGLTKGQFSLINVIEECLRQAGPSSVDISTWTAAHAEIKAAFKFLGNGMIKDLRFLVDTSFPNRQPEYCKTLIDTFGEGSVRATRTHAKFVLIRNDEWSLVIRSSMNLNENKRIEVFEISDDKGMTDYLAGIIDEFYSEPIIWSESAFNAWGGVSPSDKKVIESENAKAVEKAAPSGQVSWDLDIDI